MSFRGFLKILALVIVAAVAGSLCFLAGAAKQMKSEYVTAGVIHDLTGYVEGHDGEWPSSAADLGGTHPEGVAIDFTMTSDRILASPDLLRSAVNTTSGKFHTYPHYERDLATLLEAMRKAKSGATPAKN